MSARSQNKSLMASLLAITVMIVGSVSVAPPSLAQSKSMNVVELFTSQGCNSCPPADHLLGKFAERDDVVALSYHVSYWDYIGWKDTFADRNFDYRQHAYARRRGDRKIYTPQMIVNGRTHVVGSRQGAIVNALASHYNQDKDPQIPVDVVRKDKELQITVSGHGAVPKDGATVWLVTFKNSAEVSITRGENHGRVMTYHHVVRQIHAIGMWKGGKMEITYPLSEIHGAGGTGCAILLQAGSRDNPGAILGAAIMKNVAS